MFVSVLGAYAPTAKATPGEKQKFYTELQDTIDKVLTNDILIMLGDFNAWVGVLDHDNDLWRGVGEDTALVNEISQEKSC